MCNKQTTRLGQLSDLWERIDEVLSLTRDVSGVDENFPHYDTITRIAAMALRMLDPNQPMGTELFNAYSLLGITFAFELAIIRPGSCGLEIYLKQREGDEAYANQMHIPGTALRSGETYAVALERLCKREHLSIDLASCRVVGMLNHRHEERGHFKSFLIIADPGQEEMPGRWATADDIGEEVIPHHRLSLIPRAMAAYESGKTVPLNVFAWEEEDDNIYGQ